jgi:hypothetical protein
VAISLFWSQSKSGVGGTALMCESVSLLVLQDVTRPELQDVTSVTGGFLFSLVK